ncbi:sensor domain-containing diguanylate cyclase [Maricurvus nonylphenolicus]|uniref:sensor domain-containing diguanylate cyclase n=1 Tax=Maricurvus nonylphenolicus TaxID=1008307 RepID=UPI0036F3B8D6
MFDPNDWVLESEHLAPSLKKWQTMVNLMADIYEAPAGFVVQYTSKGYQVVIANESELNPYPAGDGVIPSETNLFCRRVVAENKPLYVKNATQLEEWQTNPEVSEDGFNSYFGMPLHWPDGSAFGTICVMDFDITHYKGPYKELIGQFRDMVEQDLVLVDQYKKVEDLSLRDSLTHSYNRRGFMTLGESLLHFARRYNKHLGLIYCDLDNLKFINDNYGHRVGDQAITEFSNRLKTVLRETDLSARIGGDEFAVLVLVDTEDELATLVERIQSPEASATHGHAAEASIGFRFYSNQQISRLDRMLDEVDKLMYANKHQRKATP